VLPVRLWLPSKHFPEDGWQSVGEIDSFPGIAATAPGLTEFFPGD
jgi:hypothetical protein